MCVDYVNRMLFTFNSNSRNMIKNSSLFLVNCLSISSTFLFSEYQSVRSRITCSSKLFPTWEQSRLSKRHVESSSRQSVTSSQRLVLSCPAVFAVKITTFNEFGKQAKQNRKLSIMDFILLLLVFVLVQRLDTQPGQASKSIRTALLLAFLYIFDL